MDTVLGVIKDTVATLRRVRTVGEESNQIKMI